MSLSVTMLAIGADPPPRVGEALISESFLVERLGQNLPGAPASALLLAFLPADCDAATLERLVRWRARAPFPCALLGCAPAGTARDSERALAAGFDDFVAGRQSVRELAVRLRAIARRLGPKPRLPGRLGVGRLVLDPAGHDLWVGERKVRLTRLEARTLAALMRAPGHTLSRADLLDNVWGDHAADTSLRAVDNLVQRLRRKVGDADSVVTIRGVGFRLHMA